MTINLLIAAVMILGLICAFLFMWINTLDKKLSILTDILQEHHEELYAHTESPFTIASDQHPTLN